MRRFVLQRLVLAIPVLLGVSIVVFALVHITPGDPVALMLGTESFDPETAAAIRRDLGLDRPLVEQFFSWLARALQGDIGRSVRTNQPVAEMIGMALPVTIQLAVLSLSLSLAIGVAAGIHAAVRRGQRSEALAMLVAVGGLSIPNYFLAILLIFAVSLKLGLLPPAGYVAMFSDPVEAIKLSLLPALTLSFRSSAAIARMLRSSLLEVLERDYVRTARAKGLAPRLIITRHALRNALIPVLTVVGLEASTLIGGTVIVETIFAWPGLGKLAADAIFARDFPVVQGVVLVVAISVVGLNLLVDLLYGVADPRISYR